MSLNVELIILISSEVENNAGQREAVKLQIWDTGKINWKGLRNNLSTIITCSWSGKIPLDNAILLSKRSRFDSRVWYFLSANIWCAHRLDSRNSRVRQSEGLENFGWKQNWPWRSWDTDESWRRLRQAARNVFPWNLFKAGRKRWVAKIKVPSN